MIRWTGTARSAWAIPLGGALVVIGIALALSGRPAMVLLAVAGLGVALVFQGVVVTVSDDGVRVEARPLRVVHLQLPLQRIASVEVTGLRPLRAGGWGYRGSLTLFGRAAWLLRRGPGIAVTLTDGKRFRVSVDDAEAGAAALAAALPRSSR